MLIEKAPKVMGILNLTPDSFYDGGRLRDIEAVKVRVEEMIGEGMDILDAGAYSSRPGAKHISVEEEWDRLEPILAMIQGNFGSCLVSVDTFRSEIARRAVEDYGVSMVNDISAGTMDVKMADTVARLNVPFIAMHMRGTPQNMQVNPEYSNLMGEIVGFFLQRIGVLRLAGVKDIIIDPGFGFGKTLDQNYEILARLDMLRILDVPIMVGLSRKSMIYNLLGQSPDDALPGTIALQVIALQKGAGILRAHDVAEAVYCRKLVEKVSSSQ